MSHESLFLQLLLITDTCSLLPPSHQHPSREKLLNAALSAARAVADFANTNWTAEEFVLYISGGYNNNYYKSTTQESTFICLTEEFHLKCFCSLIDITTRFHTHLYVSKQFMLE